MRRFFFWIVLVATSAVVLVGGLELLLQTGAWLVRATGREAPVAWLADDVRILCLGDSNTYGLYLKPHESWPAQLETSWNTTVTSPRIRVFNLGYPGTNSSKVLGDFAKMLEDLSARLHHRHGGRERFLDDSRGRAAGVRATATR